MKEQKTGDFAGLMAELGIGVAPCKTQAQQAPNEVSPPKDEKMISVQAAKGAKRHVARLEKPLLPVPEKNAQLLRHDFQGNHTRLSAEGRNLADALAHDIAWETGKTSEPRD